MKMKQNYLFLTISIWALVTLAAPCSGSADEEGNSSGGGGNAILCDDGKVYAWDYVNTKVDNMAIDPAFRNAKSAEQILKIMVQRLHNVHHGLANSLDDFLKFNADPINDSGRVWFHSKNPLINLNDEDRSRLPKACIKNAKPDFKLYQAVIRIDTAVTRYDVDDALVKKLAANSALQLSFLYVHEWLRDFSNSAANILVVNQLLHSQKFWTLNQEKFGLTLGKYGMSISDDKNYYPHNLVPGNYTLKEGNGSMESFTLKNERDGGHIQNVVAKSFIGHTQPAINELFSFTLSNLRLKENQTDALSCAHSSCSTDSDAFVVTGPVNIINEGDGSVQDWWVDLTISAEEGKPGCVQVATKWDHSRSVSRLPAEVGTYCRPRSADRKQHRNPFYSIDKDVAEI